jgi:hypothetical protein
MDPSQRSSLIFVQRGQVSHVRQFFLAVLCMNLLLRDLRPLLVDPTAVEPVQCGNDDITKAKDGERGSEPGRIPC